MSFDSAGNSWAPRFAARNWVLFDLDPPCPGSDNYPICYEEGFSAPGLVATATACAQYDYTGPYLQCSSIREVKMPSSWTADTLASVACSAQQFC